MSVKLYYGDCLNIMPNIPDKFVDMIFCDLPYGTTKCKWDSIINLELMWGNYKRIIKDNGVIALFAQTPFDKVLGSSNLKLLRYEWIWEKTSATGFLNSKKTPMKAHENILIFYKNTPLYNPQKTNGHQRKVSSANHKRNCIKTENYNNYGLSDYDSTERFPRSVLKFSSDKQRSKLHPTQKPLALCEYMVRTYTHEGMMVLDNCAGSGTTGLAAQNLNRNCILIEKEEKYVEVIENRLNIRREL